MFPAASLFKGFIDMTIYTTVADLLYQISEIYTEHRAEINLKFS